jgi:hypothetical protein
MKDLLGPSEGLLGTYPSAQSLFGLKFFDVVIVPPESRVEDLRIDFHGNLGETPKRGQTHFFDWVPRLDAVAKDFGEVDDDCFGSDAPKLRQKLFARVHLTQGRLQTGDVGRVGDEGKPVVVRLRKKGKRQAVANHVVLTIGCAAGPLKLRLKPFGGEESDVRELIFRQPVKQGNKLPTIKIEVLNLCCLEDVMPTNVSSTAGIEAFDADEDFRWNYAIIKNVDEIANVPIPLPVPMKFTPPEGSGGGADAAKCSPPRTQAAGTASVVQMLDLVKQISGLE